MIKRAEYKITDYIIDLQKGVAAVGVRHFRPAGDRDMGCGLDFVDVLVWP